MQIRVGLDSGEAVVRALIERPACICGRAAS
jgi:hypothetical protein